MRVTELFEDEEDLPIIYDIIKSKLAAGEKIWLPKYPDERSALSSIRSYELSPDNWVVDLRWHAVADGAARPVNRAMNATALANWKLKKVDGRLILYTMKDEDESY
jgi:hypothetical protein